MSKSNAKLPQDLTEFEKLDRSALAELKNLKKEIEKIQKLQTKSSEYEAEMQKLQKEFDAKLAAGEKLTRSERSRMRELYAFNKRAQDSIDELKKDQNKRLDPFIRKIAELEDIRRLAAKNYQDTTKIEKEQHQLIEKVKKLGADTSEFMDSTGKALTKSQQYTARQEKKEAQEAFSRNRREAEILKDATESELSRVEKMEKRASRTGGMIVKTASVRAIVSRAPLASKVADINVGQLLIPTLAGVESLFYVFKNVITKAISVGTRKNVDFKIFNSTEKEKSSASQDSSKKEKSSAPEYSSKNKRVEFKSDSAYFKKHAMIVNGFMEIRRGLSRFYPSFLEFKNIVESKFVQDISKKLSSISRSMNVWFTSIRKEIAAIPYIGTPLLLAGFIILGVGKIVAFSIKSIKNTILGIFSIVKGITKVIFGGIGAIFKKILPDKLIEGFSKIKEALHPKNIIKTILSSPGLWIIIGYVAGKIYAMRKEIYEMIKKYKNNILEWFVDENEGFPALIQKYVSPIVWRVVGEIENLIKKIPGVSFFTKTTPTTYESAVKSAQESLVKSPTRNPMENMDLKYLSEKDKEKFQKWLDENRSTWLTASLIKQQTRFGERLREQFRFGPSQELIQRYDDSSLDSQKPYSPPSFVPARKPVTLKDRIKMLLSPVISPSPYTDGTYNSIMDRYSEEPTYEVDTKHFDLTAQKILEQNEKTNNNISNIIELLNSPQNSNVISIIGNGNAPTAGYNPQIVMP
jgi:hypothetical protein